MRILSFSCIILFSISSSLSQPSQPTCKISSTEDLQSLQCDNVGGDTKTLIQILRQAQFTFVNGTRRVTLSFSDVAPTATQLRINFKKLKLEENTFSALPNLENLQFEGSESDAPLELPAAELAKVPRLRSITIDRCTLATSTIHALLGVKDRVTSISVWNVHPQQDVLGLLGEFTNLTDISIQNICENPSVLHPVPNSIFQKSKDKLRKIWVTDCRMPSITRDLFRGLKNARSIMWTLSHIRSVQDGAFDDLVNLEELNLMGNQIRTLPDGLFKKTKRLNEVNMRFNGVENLSRNNFTHVDNFNFFVLDVSQE